MNNEHNNNGVPGPVRGWGVGGWGGGGGRTRAVLAYTIDTFRADGREIFSTLFWEKW